MRLGFVIALALAVLAGCAPRSLPPITVIPTRYSVQVAPGDPNVLSGAATADIATNLHATAVRVYYAPPDPNGVINPDNGYVYPWVPAARAAGLLVDFITPYPAANPSATYLAAYAAFVAAGAAAYPGSVWEIVNEPDNAAPLGQPQLTEAQYLALVQAIVPAVRAADPTATIITGGTSGMTTPRAAAWIAGLRPILPLVDGVGVHPYEFGKTGKPIAQLGTALQILAGQLGKTLYVTEWGEAPQVPGDLTAFVQQTRGGVQFASVYDYETQPNDSGPFGLVGTPSFAAYASAIAGS